MLARQKLNKFERVRKLREAYTLIRNYTKTLPKFTSKISPHIAFIKKKQKYK